MPVAIIYAAKSKTVRRVVKDDSEARLVGHIGPGEGAVLYGRRVTPTESIRTRQGDEAELFFQQGGMDMPDLPKCIELVADLTGIEPEDPRCVVLDGDLKVAAVILADPALDQHELGDVVREKRAEIGDVLEPDGKFYRPYKDGRLLTPEEVTRLDAEEAVIAAEAERKAQEEEATKAERP